MIFCVTPINVQIRNVQYHSYLPNQVLFAKSVPTVFMVIPVVREAPRDHASAASVTGAGTARRGPVTAPRGSV